MGFIRTCAPATWVLVLGSCAPADRPPEPLPLDEMVRLEGSLTLEETPEVLNVHMRVTIDPRGGFLIADAGEAQFREYDTDGALRGYFGARGDGPGEFRNPRAMVRLPAFGLLAFDRDRRAALFDPENGELVRSYATDFGPLEAARSLGDSLVVVASPAMGDRLGPQIHLWDPADGQTVAGFFEPTVEEEMRPFVSMMALTVIDVRADTVAAVFSASDTIYLFDEDGRALERFAFASAAFRPVRQPREDLAADPLAPIRWAGSFDVVSGLHWLPSGEFLIQYQTMDDEGGWLYRTLHVARDGSWLGEAVDTPRLFTVEPDGPTLYFENPQVGVPNEWVYGRLRSR